MPTFILNPGKENEGSIIIPGDVSFSIYYEVKSGKKTTILTVPRRYELEYTTLFDGLNPGILESVYPDPQGKVNGRNEKYYEALDPSGRTFKIPSDSDIRVIFRD